MSYWKYDGDFISIKTNFWFTVNKTMVVRQSLSAIKRAVREYRLVYAFIQRDKGYFNNTGKSVRQVLLAHYTYTPKYKS